MHYLIKMCSLCLCHNKDLTKVDKIQQKYYNFLKKVLIQPSDADKMKLEEEFLCKMCIDKLESCFGLSELCIKNKIYSTFCCVCTNSDRSKLMNLRKISPEVASFYCKLIKSVRPQIFTCEKCLEKLNFYLQFQKACVKNDEMIFGYMQQLTNFSTEKLFKNTNVTIKIEKLDEETIEKLTARKPTTTTTTTENQDQENLDQEKTETQNQEKVEAENREKFLSNVQIVDVRSVKQEQIDIEENLIYEPEPENENEPHEIIPECKIEICDEDNFNREPAESNPPFNFTEETEQPETANPKRSNMNYEESTLFFNHFLDSSGNDFDQNHGNDMDMDVASEINPNDLLKIDENPDSPNPNNSETFTCKFCPDNKNIKSFKLHKFVHLDKSKNECLICHKQIKYYKNLVAHLRKHYREKPVVYYTTADMTAPQQNRETNASTFINPNFYTQPNHYVSEIQETKATNSNFNVNHNMLENYYNPEVSIVPKSFISKGNDFASKARDFALKRGNFASTGSNFALKGSGFAPKGSDFVSKEDFASTGSDFDSKAGIFVSTGSNFASTGSDFALKAREFTSKGFSGDFVPKEEKSDPELDPEPEPDFDPNSNATDDNFDVVSTFKNIPNLDSFGLQYLEEDVENMEESVESENFNDESGMSIESNGSGNNGNGEKFICKFCPDDNNIFDSYRTHKFEHMDRIKVQCLICFKKLKYYRNLVVHVTDHFKGTQFYCPYCKMHQGEKLVEHKYKHINQAQNLCLICLKKFENFNSLNVHIHTHFKNWQRYKKLTQTNPTSPLKVNSQSQILHRQLLKKKILQNNSLERLEVTPTLNFDMFQNEPSTSSNDLFICPFCPGRQYSSQKQHKFVHMDRVNNVCLICNSKFAAYKYLYKHLMKHFYRTNPYANSNSNPNSQIRPIAIRQHAQHQNQFSIDLTSESTPRETQSFPPSYLKSLLSNEITLLPYDPRNQKGAPPQQKVNKNIHFNANILGLPLVREKEREIVTDQTYTCPFCDDKEFSSFLEHKNVHIDRENNQCLICNGRFTGYAYVDRHVTKHLNERKNEICAVNTENNEFFNCQYCNCVVEETYYKHFYKHVNINERFCLICNKEFIHIKYLYKHLRNHFGYAKIKKFHIPDPTEDGLLRSCPFCIEPVNESLPLHRLVHIDPINKICLICYKRFGADENLLSHIAFHFRHFYRNYKTPTTTTTVKSEKSVPKIKSVPTLKVFKNAIAVSVDNQAQIETPELKPEVVGLVCPFCPNFAIEDLSDHKGSHIKPDGNQCLICSESFGTLPEVKDHIEQHFAEADSDSKSVMVSTKLFCRYCNIEVLRKSFEKHKISNMHLYYVKKNPLKKPLDPNASNSPNAGRSFCRVCKVYLNRKGFGKHKNSKIHRDNLRNKFPEKLEKKTNVSHRTFCRFCQTYITTKNFDEHKRTKKHLENIKISKSERKGNDNVNDDNSMENENFEGEKVSAEVSAELVSELSNVDDNDTSITLDNLKSQIMKNQNDFEDEDEDGNGDNNENLDHSESVTLENIEDQIVSDDKDNDQKPDKYFCSLCNTEVLKKSFAKHTISKMHLENLHSKNKNDGNIEKGGSGGGGGGKRCPKCNRGFANQTSYLRHVKGDCKFVPAKFQCELCKARFRRRYILGAHMQKVHGLSVMDSI